jgi:amino acid transporter
MKDGVSFLIQFLAVADLAGTVIAYVIVRPSPSTPRRDWLKRSLLSGFAIGLGSVVFLTCLWLSQTPNPDYGKLWSSFSALTILIIPVGVFVAFLSYVGALTWSWRRDLFKRFIQNRRSRQR